MTTLAERETQLKARFAELDKRLHGIEESLDDEPSKDFEERAVERESDEVLEGIGAAGLNELRQIKSALDRIENGTYGECASCGEAISQERLDAVPYTALCRNCAAGK